MPKPLRARWIAPEIHALLFVSMWIFDSLSSQPLADGLYGPVFVILLAADFPISLVAFGIMFTSVKYGAIAALVWGILGTLWWVLIGGAIDAGIRRYRERRALKTSPGTLTTSKLDASHSGGKELLVSITAVAVILTVSLAWQWNGPQGRYDRGKISNLTFAPDNRSIALVRSWGKSSTIESVDLSTGRSVPIKTAIPCEASSPAYSPDGKLIAFVCGDSANDSSHIFIMNTDGGNLRPLPSSSPNEYEFAPHFATGGGELFFARASPSEPIAGGQSVRQSWDLYAASLDGKNVHALTERRFKFFVVSFSHDSRTVVISGEATNGTQVLVYSLDDPDKGATVIQPLIPGASQPPVISDVALGPDGHHIYFMAATDGKKGFDYDVYRTDLSGNDVEKLTSANGYSTDLCLSSDGKTAAFLRWTARWGSLPNLSRLYKFDLSTKRLTPLEVTGTQ